MNSRSKTSRFAGLLLAHLCAFTLCAPNASAQAVKPVADPMPPQRTQASLKDSQIQKTNPSDDGKGETGDEGDVVKLGTFEVTASSGRYYQDVTMAGTRIGANIMDLGTSITTITTEMMDDFGMTDINDIFNFEVGTEGAATFSDITVDANGNVTDGNMDDRAGSNRVRGLARPTRTYAFFEVIGMPTDRLIMGGSATLIRGPNSIIGGLGSPAGIMDSTPISPSLRRNKSEARLRLFSDGTFRQTLDFNRVLISNRLAVSAQQMFQHFAFQRKPSGVNQELYNFAVKYQPFKNTIFSVNYTRVRESGNTANAITPGDGITPWKERGEQTWDPMQQYGNVANNTFGVIYDKNGNIIRNGAPPGSGRRDPYLPGDNFRLTPIWSSGGSGVSAIQVDRNGIFWWGATRGINDAASIANYPNSTIPGTYAYYMTRQTPVHDLNLPLPIAYGAVRGVSDQNIYDWSRINIAATDRRYTENNALLVRLAQTIIDTQNQYLAVELGWFREDQYAYRKTLMGRGKKNTVSSYLGIDVNRRLFDGSQNENFLRPYLAVNYDMVNEQPVINDSYRAQVAYSLDFRQNKGWSRWLGRHAITGYAEYKHYETRNYNYRHALVSEHEYAPAGTPRGNTNVDQAANTGLPQDQRSNDLMRIYTLYYVGDRIGQNIDYAPGTLTTGRYVYTWGNPATGSFSREAATLGLAADLAGSAGINNNLKISKGAGAVIQSHLLRDGVVVTLGRRYDTVYQKDGVPPRLLPDGITFDHAYNNQWLPTWRVNSGPTKTEGVVIHPAAWIRENTPKWLRPLRHFSFFYNQASSIDLNVAAGYNFKGNMVPNPSGKGKDYGFTAKLFNDNFILRFNRYENHTLNQRGGGVMNAPVGRLLELDIYAVNYDLDDEDGSLEEQREPNRQFGLNKRASDWEKTKAIMAGEIISDAELLRRVANFMQMTPERLQTLQFYRPNVVEPNEGLAKGYELSLYWKVNEHLNVIVGASRAESKVVTVSPGFQEMLDERLEFWQTVRNPLTGALWWTEPPREDGGGTTPQTWYNESILPDWELAKAYVGVSQPNVSKYTATFRAHLSLKNLTRHRILRGMSFNTAIRWQSPVSIGNYGMETIYDEVKQEYRHTRYDPGRVIWEKPILYVEIGATYKTKILNGKVGAEFRAGITNLFEDGGIRPVRADSNGVPTVFRIVDPRMFTIEARFGF